MTIPEQESELAAESAFDYGSSRFQAALKENAHHYGEVRILEATAEPGMTALELGANRGVTTVALAHAVGPEGRVHAFEPVPEYHAALRANLERNHIDNVTPHRLAMTDQKARAPYFKHGEGSGIVQVEDAERILVDTISVDAFFGGWELSVLDYLNMDCEGAELLVLQGAADTLAKNAPRILCEIHHDYLAQLGQSVRDIVRCLQGFGFQVAPVQVEQLQDEVDLEHCSHVFAVKNEGLPDMRHMGRISAERR